MLGFVNTHLASVGVFRRNLDGLVAGGIKPALHRLVVVRARVDHAVFFVHVRKEGVDHSVLSGLARVKGELKHFHARKAAAVAKRAHAFRYKAQVFGDDRNVAQLFFYRVKEGAAGAGNPFSVDGGFLPKRNRPIGLKAPKVVDADDVNKLKAAADSGHPPIVVCLCHRVPVVKGVSPQLAGRAKVVRRNSGHGLGRSVRLQLEELLASPNVRRVGRDKNRNVADDFYSLFVGVFF